MLLSSITAPYWFYLAEKQRSLSKTPGCNVAPKDKIIGHTLKPGIILFNLLEPNWLRVFIYQTQNDGSENVRN